MSGQVWKEKKGTFIPWISSSGEGSCLSPTPSGLFLRPAAPPIFTNEGLLIWNGKSRQSQGLSGGEKLIPVLSHEKILFP